MAFKTVQSALTTALAGLALIASVVLLWAYLDSGFRDRLAGWVGDRYLGAVIERSSRYRVLTAERDAAQAGLEAAAAENAGLRAEVERLSGQQQDLERADRELTELRAAHRNTEEELEAERQRVEREKATHQAAFDELQEKLRQTERSSEIAIEQLRDNLTIIRVGDQVLFDSGSATLKPSGREVLELIAGTLNKFENRLIRIEGHTDDRPIVNPETRKRFDSNWELSTARAVAALRFLEETGQVTPARMVAAGFGSHHPVADNADAAGRARNRRIEIVLMPAEETFRVRDLAPE